MEKKLKKKKESPFASRDDTFVYMLRVLLCLSGEVSPQILHDATGVQIDLCIEFCAACLANYLYDSPPESKKEFI